MIPPEYANIDALNWSRLKLLDTSPRAYLENARQESTGFALGSLVHVLALEPERFAEIYYVADIDGTTREGRALKAMQSGEMSAIQSAVLTGTPEIVRYQGRKAGSVFDTFRDAYKPGTIFYSTKAEVEHVEAAQQAAKWYHESNGRQIISTAELAQARKCVDALNDHPEARALLDRCPRREEIVQFNYRGRNCKALRDLVGPGVVADLKTCADLGKFRRDIGRYLYHGQVEFYGLPDSPAELFLIAVSTTDYDVGVFRMTEHTRYQARLLIDRLLDRLEECERLSRWPGRYPFVEDYDLPEYMSEEPDISF